MDVRDRGAVVRVNRLFVFGLGYSAKVLAWRLMAEGWQVAGTTRSAEKAAALRQEGIDAVLFDGAAPGPDVGRALDGTTHLLVSILPGEDGDPVLGHHRADIVARASAMRWIGYLSTVGVYGDFDGAWIDETATPRPVSTRGKRRVIAETAWTCLGRQAQVPVAAFRIAGIYGPGRNQLRSLRDGKARRIVKPDQVFNRIHVEDIATALAASMTRPAARIYNLADDLPCPPQEVVAHAAELMGVEPPPEVPFDEAEMTPMARSFYGDNKRVSNARIREELGVALAYPTYREGLAALYAAGEDR